MFPDGPKPPPVTIHPLQQQAIFQQILDHLSPQEVEYLRGHVTPMMVQLLMKAHLPQFAQFLMPILQSRVPQQQPPNVAQNAYNNIRGS